MINIQQHKSFTFSFILNDEYDLNNFQDLEVVIGSYFAKFTDGSISRPADRVFKLQLSSKQTDQTGPSEMQVYLHDAEMATVPGSIIPICYLKSIGKATNEKNSGSNATVNLEIADDEVLINAQLEAVHIGPAGDGLASIDIANVKQGDVVNHNKNSNLVVIGFYNSGTATMEMPSSFEAQNININSFTFATGLGANYDNTLFNGKLLCLKI